MSQTGGPPDFPDPYWPEGIPIPEVVDFDQRDQMNAWWRGWHGADTRSGTPTRKKPTSSETPFSPGMT